MDFFELFFTILLYLEAFLLLVFLMGIIYTILYAVTYFKLAKKAYFEKPWLAFIPFGVSWIKFKTTNTPTGTFFIALGGSLIGPSLISIGENIGFFPVSLIGYAILIFAFFVFFVVECKFLAAFGKSKSLVLLGLLGPLPMLILYMVIAFGRSEYVGPNDGIGNVLDFNSFPEEEREEE